MSTWTIRCSSSDVTVSGGISTTTSPRGRSSTPRSTAAAHTRRPHAPTSPAPCPNGKCPAPCPNGKCPAPCPNGVPLELDATHQPAEAHLAHRRVGGDAIVEQRPELVGTRPYVGEHVPHVDQLEVAQRDRGGERVSRVGVPVVERAGREIGAEERIEHTPLATVADIGEVPGGDALAEHEQVRAEIALLGREQRAGAAEARGHLVADQEDAVLAARGAERARGRRGRRAACPRRPARAARR